MLAKPTSHDRKDRPQKEYICKGQHANPKLLILRNIAPSQALLYAQGDIGRDHCLELVDVGSRQGLLATKSGLDDISGQLHECVQCLLRACIFIVETCDEYRGCTQWVELHVERALREHRHLIKRGVSHDSADAIFEDHGGGKCALHDNVELCAARVCMRGIHPAWVHEADCH